MVSTVQTSVRVRTGAVIRRVVTVSVRAYAISMRHVPSARVLLWVVIPAGGAVPVQNSVFWVM